MWPGANSPKSSSLSGRKNWQRYLWSHLTLQRWTFPESIVTWLIAWLRQTARGWQSGTVTAASRCSTWNPATSSIPWRTPRLHTAPLPWRHWLPKTTCWPAGAQTEWPKCSTSSPEKTLPLLSTGTGDQGEMPKGQVLHLLQVCSLNTNSIMLSDHVN